MTMVRNDDFFLRKWVDYYASQLGRENLWIYFDGHDQLPAPDYTAGSPLGPGGRDTPLLRHGHRH